MKSPHIPYALEAVHAGFPSVAQDYFIQDFSLDHHIITHPDTTFAIRVAGDSMEGAGIYDTDILLVDKSLTPLHYDIVIAIVDGEMTVKRLIRNNKTMYLHPENKKYPDIAFSTDNQVEIWGVVIGNYHFQRHNTYHE